MIEDFVSKQIAKVMTDKYLIETIDKLNPAPLDIYAHIHAGGEPVEGEFRKYSCIGITLLDYSKGKGNNKITAKANISPETVEYLYWRAALGIKGVEFSENKIFGKPDENGKSRATFLTIKRTDKDSSGQLMKYPWSVNIDCGTAVPAKNANGGTYMSKGTYASEAKADMKISDKDFFELMCRTYRYINAWELTMAPKLIRDAGVKMAELAAKRAQDGQNSAAKAS